MDIKWWISSVIVPIFCATIGGVFGFLACTVKYKMKMDNSTKNKINARKNNGKIIQDSNNTRIN